MSFDAENPFAAPQTLATVLEDYGPGNDVLARRFTRFAAVFVDGIVLMLIVVPIQLFLGVWQTAMAGQPLSTIESLGMSLIGVLAFLSLNGYLLFCRGQTIGKLLTRIQIVDYESGKLLPLYRVYVMRYLWILPLSLLVIFIPGTSDDLSVSAVSLIDALFIFGASRRCLHDYIAGTTVVEYREDRPRLKAG